MPYCPRCGYQALDIARFCERCGTPLAGLEQQSSALDTGQTQLVSRSAVLTAAAGLLAASDEARQSPSGAAADVSPIWEERHTDHLIFYFEPYSYAAEAFDQVAGRGEAAYRRGWEWFGGEEPPPITVYLTGWLGEADQEGWIRVADALLATRDDIIWLVASPEAPAIGLERLILEVLARAGGGPVPGHASGVLRGLAALIAAEQGTGLSIEEAAATSGQQYGRGKKTPRLFEAETSQSSPVADPAELSFLAFLLQAHGTAALAQFARGVLTSPVASAISAAYGRSLKDLQHQWLATLRQQQKGSTGLDVIRKALPFLRPHWLREVELLGYMAFDLVFGLAIPLSTKYLFDDIIGPQDFSRLAIWLVVVPAIFAVGSYAGYRRVVVGGLVGELVLRDLRRAGFAQLQRLSLRFYNRSSTGDLLSRITNDMDRVQMAVGEILPQLAFDAASLVSGVIVLLLLDWMLALAVLLVGVPVFTVTYTRASGRLREAGRDLTDRIGEMTGFVQENLSAQMVVKSFSLEKRATTSFEDFLSQLYNGSMRMIRISAILSGTTNVTYLGIRVLILGAGAVLIMNGRMSVGGLVAFVSLIGQVLSPMMSISGQYRQLQSATGAFDRIQEVMNEVPDVVESSPAVALPVLQRDIRLEHVTFRYGEGEGGIQDVSLTIPAGKKVAIVGPSGAGKSTAVGLLLRLYDPNEGRILFDGQDIREASFVSLRGQIAVVPQDTFLFNATIAENIALGREDATDEDVRKAAEAAALHQVIERTEAGYQTVAGERGVRFSGGQRQRLAIARALIRDPQVLILDEATSALDPETEASIMRTLEQVGRGRTTIMITHRLTSAVGCDLIFVLDKGRLAEQGSHRQLLELRGLYYRLYNEQQAGVLESMGMAIGPWSLARVPLFASLNPEDLAAVALRGAMERYEPESIIMRQGEAADKFYVIADGQVEVLVHDSSGELRRVQVLSAPAHFGEIALLGDELAQRTATVRAITRTELYSLRKEDFLALLRSQPRLAETVSRLAQMRAEQTRQITGSVAGSISGANRA